MFNLYIYELIDVLQQNDVEVRAYADDLVLATQSQTQMTKSIEAIDTCCSNNNIKVYRSKSAVLLLK